MSSRPTNRPSIKRRPISAQIGVEAEAIEADLATIEGVDRLCDAIAGRPVDLLFANAGRGLGKGFLDQDFAAIEHVVDTNVRGTIYLVHRVGRQMRARGKGRIMITGSIAGFVPGAYQAIYNATQGVYQFIHLRAPGGIEGQRGRSHLPDARPDGNALLRARRRSRIRGPNT